jgi:hypothetical protein
MTVKGRFNGSVVVLDEPAPVDHEVPVTVEFPESDEVEANTGAKRFNWITPSELSKLSAISFADELIRQRRMD